VKLLLSSAEFASASYRLDWLVRKLLVMGQPCILGGPKKSLKTNLLVDLAISIGTGTPALGVFQVPTPRRVALISGETGEPTLQETFFRVCSAKGVERASANVWWDFRLPQLAEPEELAELANGLRERSIEVVLIDPLYLCLLSGETGQGIEASNMFKMGPLLLRVARACQRVGATPILAAHARKFRQGQSPHDPMDLEDLAFAGIQEFARQWLLVNRREPYQPGTGGHRLWLSSGGSAGHGNTWGLDINEGVLDDDFRGRTWEVKVIEQAAVYEQRKQAKEEDKASDEISDGNKLLNSLKGIKLTEGEFPTTTKLRLAVGWYRPKYERVLASLVRRGLVREVVEKYTGTKGADLERTRVVVIESDG
jgi:replicative DNA helicase